MRQGRVGLFGADWKTRSVAIVHSSLRSLDHLEYTSGAVVHIYNHSEDNSSLLARLQVDDMHDGCRCEM
jgi:hypothetical protein